VPPFDPRQRIHGAVTQGDLASGGQPEGRRPVTEPKAPRTYSTAILAAQPLNLDTEFKIEKEKQDQTTTPISIKFDRFIVGPPQLAVPACFDPWRLGFEIHSGRI
jgi:hypothetical protein